jgi:hypothetical protein
MCFDYQQSTIDNQHHQSTRHVAGAAKPLEREVPLAPERFGSRISDFGLKKKSKIRNRKSKIE